MVWGNQLKQQWLNPDNLMPPLVKIPNLFYRNILLNKNISSCLGRNAKTTCFQIEVYLWLLWLPNRQVNNSIEWNGMEYKNLFYNRLTSGVALLKKRRHLSATMFSNQQLSTQQTGLSTFMGQSWQRMFTRRQNAHPANYSLLQSIVRNNIDKFDQFLPTLELLPLCITHKRGATPRYSLLIGQTTMQDENMHRF